MCGCWLKRFRDFSARSADGALRRRGTDSRGIASRCSRNTRVGSEIANAHLIPLLASVLIATASFMVRAFRWGLLVRDDHGRDVPLRARWDAVAMSFMANNILPLRAGEVLRAYAITRLAPVRFTGSIASLVVERVFDALTLVLLLSVGLLLSGLSTDTTVAIHWIAPRS